MEYTGTDFLVENGYKVGIVGGKHSRTPDGEYVELKNGTNYEIFVGNSHDEGCTVDIAIDSHPVGKWTLKGNEAFEIQRPANDERNFTFYRVTQAPEGSGIETGREENGLIECVFTPEANIPVRVSTPDLLEPIQFQLSPCASMMDVKFEAQRRLGLEEDFYQVLVRGNQILDNFDELRENYIEDSPEAFLLLSDQLKITIETSTDQQFEITVHPREDVNYVMEEIMHHTNVHVQDQELYHGETRISDSPLESLPGSLIRDKRPLLKVVVPECVQIFVQVSEDEKLSVKIDKTRSLGDLQQRLPRMVLPGAHEFVLNGTTLEVDTTASLQDYGVLDGSVLMLKKKEKTRRTIARNRVGISWWTEKADALRVLLAFLVVLMLELYVNEAREMQLVCFGLFVDFPEHLGYRVMLISVLLFLYCVVAPYVGYGYSAGYMPMLYFALFVEFPEHPYTVMYYGVWLFLCYVGTPDVYGSGKNSAGIPFISGWTIMKRHWKQRSNRALGATRNDVVSQPRDQSWRAGGTTLQGVSDQQLVQAPPIRVDPSRKVVLTVRLVAREDEEPIECTPLSTL